MPLQVLPLDLPGESMTELMQEAVKEMLAELEPLSREIYADGVLPGTYSLSSAERLANYYSNTDPADWALMFEYDEALGQWGTDENYLLRLRNGLDAPPVSPFWLNMVSTQGTFERNRRDFMRLVNQDQAKRVQGLK